MHLKKKAKSAPEGADGEFKKKQGPSVGSRLQNKCGGEPKLGKAMW